MGGAISFKGFIQIKGGFTIMMRITNSMMTTNTKNNININKINEDEKNTQTATGQKISRPSDDPVIAIRALRFNTTISQLNQYHDKNIPDATQWLSVTETALKQTDQMFTSIKGDLTTGASDTNTATDRQKILQNLKGIRDEFYATGNADYAGRTVFTGYRTGESLTFLTTDTDRKDNYKIYQNISKDDVSKMTYITSPDIEGGASETDVESSDVIRLRLPYDNLNEEDGTTLSIDVYDIDPETEIKTKNAGQSIDVTVKSIAGQTQDYIDKLYTGDATVWGADQVVLIPETGELIFRNQTTADKLDVTSNQSITFEYNKNSWNSGELRPEHYFACDKKDDKTGKIVQYNYSDEVNKKTGVKTGNKIPDFQNQDIEIEVAFNQKITVNTHADEVYTHDIGRDIDDLIVATQDVVDAEELVEKYKEELSKASSEADKAAAQAKLDTANKEFSLKKDKMQKMFSEALNVFEGYADKNNVAIADIGSMSSRLKITKERVASQLDSFTELADDNININLTDAAIDLKNAEIALQAAQLAASKIAQQTLLNYL